MTRQMHICPWIPDEDLGQWLLVTEKIKQFQEIADIRLIIDTLQLYICEKENISYVDTHKKYSKMMIH